MSDAGEGAAWCTGLRRSYSEHADLVLRHLQQQRRENRRAAASRCTRSDLQLGGEPGTHSEADDEDEEAGDSRNDGRRTWRISDSTTSDEPRQRYRSIELSCGDSRALTDNFSDLSLNQKRSFQSYQCPVVSSSESHKTKKTTSSTERRCQIFDQYEIDEDEDEDGDKDERFTLIDSDEDDEYRRRDRRSGVQKFGPGPRNSHSNERRSDEDRAHQHQNGESTDGPCRDGMSSVSMTSLSSANSEARQSSTQSHRQISFENWARDKQRELQRRRDDERRAEEKRRELEESERRRREEKERQDYESYVKWLERKRREKLLKHELREKEQKLRDCLQQIKEKERMSKRKDLIQWSRRKEEQMKASEQEELLKKKKSEEEKQKRLQNSEKAYEMWREKAKNTPRPATQGLLPHQKAKPAFTNPTPWQPLINNGSEDSDSASQTKISTLPGKSRSKKSLSSNKRIRS